VKVHKEKAAEEAAASEELDGGASPEEEEESSISSTSKPVTDMKVTRTFFRHIELGSKNWNSTQLCCVMQENRLRVFENKVLRKGGGG
jgi:hypothetical protein